MGNIFIIPDAIQVERSARANEQMQIVSGLISKLGVEQSQKDELVYEVSKLLLFSETDCVVSGYAMGLDAIQEKVKTNGRRKWLF